MVSAHPVNTTWCSSLVGFLHCIQRELWCGGWWLLLLAAYNYLFNLFEPGKPYENTSENILYKIYIHIHIYKNRVWEPCVILTNLKCLALSIFPKCKVLTMRFNDWLSGFSLFSHYLQETSIGGFSYQLFSTFQKLKNWINPWWFQFFPQSENFLCNTTAASPLCRFINW